MKTVIEMAREAGVTPGLIDASGLYFNRIERLVDLARADEREACAKLCEGIVALNEYAYADECATVIRAKENT